MTPPFQTFCGEAEPAKSAERVIQRGQSPSGLPHCRKYLVERAVFALPGFVQSGDGSELPGEAFAKSFPDEFAARGISVVIVEVGFVEQLVTQNVWIVTVMLAESAKVAFPSFLLSGVPDVEVEGTEPRLTDVALVAPRRGNMPPLRDLSAPLLRAPIALFPPATRYPPATEASRDPKKRSSQPGPWRGNLTHPLSARRGRQAVLRVLCASWLSL